MEKNKTKTYETKLQLTLETKEKLKALALKTKKTNSDLVSNLVDNFDQDLDIFKNTEYIKSREKVFVDIAQLAKNLAQYQAEFFNAVKQIEKNINSNVDSFRDEISSTEQRIKSQVSDYRNSNIETQNKIAQHFREQTSKIDSIKNFIENLSWKSLLGKK
ncbi:TPA: hypothetical protein QDB40_004863 [Burkholderia vietnamiensis]|uniref:hypothetical protein n=1 Tax=Burkholderia vietnamiensis TaxID=60552 RepID=UPI001593A083|nr:hypothetical protein [Burkholderia vietnamiensis]HDR9102664.1 hypothetical protein [Burkholderia vietnamiensis]HDR9170830.1 hypothetical protein [Burkholderia vietnamiensis]